LAPFKLIPEPPMLAPHDIVDDFTLPGFMWQYKAGLQGLSISKHQCFSSFLLLQNLSSKAMKPTVNTQPVQDRRCCCHITNLSSLWWCKGEVCGHDDRSKLFPFGYDLKKEPTRFLAGVCHAESNQYYGGKMIRRAARKT